MRIWRLISKSIFVGRFLVFLQIRVLHVMFICSLVLFTQLSEKQALLTIPSFILQTSEVMQMKEGVYCLGCDGLNRDVLLS